VHSPGGKGRRGVQCTRQIIGKDGEQRDHTPAFIPAMGELAQPETSAHYNSKSRAIMRLEPNVPENPDRWLEQGSWLGAISTCFRYLRKTAFDLPGFFSHQRWLRSSLCLEAAWAGTYGLCERRKRVSCERLKPKPINTHRRSASLSRVVLRA
jgi:hypothetical protein